MLALNDVLFPLYSVRAGERSLHFLPEELAWRAAALFNSTTYLIADANEGIVSRKLRRTGTKIKQSEKAANDEPPACRLTEKLYFYFIFFNLA